MLRSLISFYLLRPWRYQDLWILYNFRQEREKRTGYVGLDLEKAQYEWCAGKVNAPVERIKKVVDHWIFSYPNPLLTSCIYPGVKALFKKLSEKGILIAIYSDYKAVEKMAAMGLQADLIVSSTDVNIDTFKPDPKAVDYIMNKFKVTRDECLFIGDREELDGQCALNAGVQYLILDKKSDPEGFFGSIQNRITQ
jgi:phosphoglycolate phosphatase/putative hydrolase of the HAD superfamily